MEILSHLVIPGGRTTPSPLQQPDGNLLRGEVHFVGSLTDAELADLHSLANSNHVIVRALTALRCGAGLENETRVADWCTTILSMERARIERALTYLQSICSALESRGCDISVIKSLDHWPDLGSDLDLYTTADPRDVKQWMRAEFGAHPVERSWGDRLANKWNYSVPGLPELVEIHVQYLGQTGEHAEIARRVIRRRRPTAVGGFEFFVPAPEERIVISTLQRIYRHFYFRLCDMIDTASLLRTGAVDFDELRAVANSAGIWPGVATYLCLIRNYLEAYGDLLFLPDSVIESAHSADSNVMFKAGFLRVPKTKAAGLYGLQLLQAGLRRDVRALVRLPLLPPLAVSALVAHTLTGNDKGIW